MCKFQNDWNKNSKWMLTEVRYKMCKWKGTKNLITARNVLQCRTLNTRKGIINAYEPKAKVQTTTKIQCDAQASTGTKRCSAKTG